MRAVAAFVWIAAVAAGCAVEPVDPPGGGRGDAADVSDTLPPSDARDAMMIAADAVVPDTAVDAVTVEASSRDASAARDVASADASVDAPADATPAVDSSADATVDDAAADASADTSAAPDVATPDASTPTTMVAGDILRCVHDTVALYCLDASANLVSIQISSGTRTVLTPTCPDAAGMATDGVDLYWICPFGTNPSDSLYRIPVTGGTLTNIGATNWELWEPGLIVAGQYDFECTVSDLEICTAPTGSLTPDSLTGAFGVGPVGLSLRTSHPWETGTEAPVTDGTQIFHYYPGTYDSSAGIEDPPAIVAWPSGASWPAAADGTHSSVAALAVTADYVFAIEPAYSQAQADVVRLSRATGETLVIGAADVPGQLFADDTHVYFWNQTAGLQRIAVDGGAVETIDPRTDIESAFTAGTFIYWVNLDHTLSRRAR